MRFAFGLIGLLVTVGIIVLILHFAVLPYNKTVIQKGNKAREQAEQMAGIGDNGMRTSESITLEPQTDSSGKPVSLLVTKIVMNGPMAMYFGLLRNDTITEINGMRVRDDNDGELSVAKALEAYQRQQTLTVVRNGETITLPRAQPANPVAGAPAGTAAAPAATPAQPTKTSDGDGIQGQLEAIRAAGGAVR